MGPFDTLCTFLCTEYTGVAFYAYANHEVLHTGRGPASVTPSFNLHFVLVFSFRVLDVGVVQNFEL